MQFSEVKCLKLTRFSLTGQDFGIGFLEGMPKLNLRFLISVLIQHYA